MKFVWTFSYNFIVGSEFFEIFRVHITSFLFDFLPKNCEGKFSGSNSGEKQAEY